MNYQIRSATPDDHDFIYALKTESVRPYVEKIWGWDEAFQREDFDNDFTSIEQFYVIEIDNTFAGYMQYFFEDAYLVTAEIHLPPACRGKGVGSDILRGLQKTCINQDKKIRLGCFCENLRAKALYRKLGFVQIGQTDTHFLLEYPG